VAWKPDYITSAELKSELHMDVGDVADDAQIARWVTSASRTVDDWAHRQFGQEAAPVARTYEAEYDRHQAAWIVDVDDIGTLTGLSIAVDGQAALLGAEYTLLPRNALLDGMVYEQIKIGGGTSTWGTVAPWASTSSAARVVEVTARFGWPAVPVPIKQATLMQALRLEARRSSPFGIAGSPQQGSELRLLEKLDVDAAMVAKAYRRDWWAS
jgi:hypothetical protein